MKQNDLLGFESPIAKASFYCKLTFIEKNEKIKKKQIVLSVALSIGSVL